MYVIQRRVGQRDKWDIIGRFDTLVEALDALEAASPEGECRVAEEITRTVTRYKPMKAVGEQQARQRGYRLTNNTINETQTGGG